MSTYKVFLFVIFTACCFKVNAGTTGNQLLEYCSKAENFLQNGSKYQADREIMSCLSRVDGFKDGILVSHIMYNPNKETKMKGICIPNNVNTIQLTSVIVKWLKDNPKDRHSDAVIVMMFALESAYPC